MGIDTGGSTVIYFKLQNVIKDKLRKDTGILGRIRMLQHWSPTERQFLISLRH